MTLKQAQSTKPGDHIVFQSGCRKGDNATVVAVDVVSSRYLIWITYNHHGKEDVIAHPNVSLLTS